MICSKNAIKKYSQQREGWLRHPAFAVIKCWQAAPIMQASPALGYSFIE
jgi:hypothetical protein